MNIVNFAYRVDTLTGMTRSKLSVIQKAVADQLIADHHAAGSTPDECARIVKDSLVSLSNNS